MEASMLKHVAIALLFFHCLLLSVAQQSQGVPQAAAPESSTVPAAAKNLANPVKPTPESIAQGNKYYLYDCAMCHGKNGDGKGDIDTGEKLPDFTNSAALKDKTDGELFYALKNGKGHMPLERTRVTSNELWNLVNYVRSLAK
jgi:mono/diheme cytochrome c family protein